METQDDERAIWSSGATASSFPGIPRRVAHHVCRMEVAITNQEASPEDLDVHDHGSIDPTLLDSLVEDLGVRELDEDQCSSAGSESCWGETESIGEVVEWGTLPLPSSINQALAHPSDIANDFHVCLPSPHQQDGSRQVRECRTAKEVAHLHGSRVPSHHSRWCRVE